MDLLDAELEGVEVFVKPLRDDRPGVGRPEVLEEAMDEFLGLGDGGPSVAIDAQQGLLDLPDRVEHTAGKSGIS
jgi:hypothetical protein